MDTNQSQQDLYIVVKRRDLYLMSPTDTDLAQSNLDGALSLMERWNCPKLKFQVIEISDEWDGKGLPPAGVACEYKRNLEWVPVEIFAVKPNVNGSTSALFTYEGGAWGACAEPTFFRPLKTPEQIAADKRLGMAKKLLKAIFGPLSSATWETISEERREMLLKMIDDGWTKQVKQ